MNSETFEDLMLFNEKAQLLLESSFSDSMLREETGFIAEFKVGQKVDSVIVSAEGESVIAAHATLRMFYQDNDRLSIRNIAKLYEKELELDKFKQQVESIRSELNEYLDNKIDITFCIDELEKRYTNRQAFELLLYGSTCHTNRNKYAELKRIMSYPIISDIFLNQANTVAAVFINFIVELSNINKRALLTVSPN